MLMISLKGCLVRSGCWLGRFDWKSSIFLRLIIRADPLEDFDPPSDLRESENEHCWFSESTYWQDGKWIEQFRAALIWKSIYSLGKEDHILCHFHFKTEPGKTDLLLNWKIKDVADLFFDVWNETYSPNSRQKNEILVSLPWCW